MLNDAREAVNAGLVLRDQGFVQDSVDRFREALRLIGPDDVATRRRPSMLLAEALSALGEHAAADAIYSDLLESPALDPDVLMNVWRLRSALRLAQGRLSDARSFLENAEALRPSVWSSSELLDLDYQSGAQLAAEGDRESAHALLTDLVTTHPDGPDDLRRQAYSRLTMASIALAEHDSERAARLAQQVLEDCETHESALRRVRPQALHVVGEARLAAAEYAAAEAAFDAGTNACEGPDGVYPELRRVHIEARMGLAAAQRAMGRAPSPRCDARRVLAEVEHLQDNAAIKARCLLVLAHSRIRAAMTAACDDEVATSDATGGDSAGRDVRRRALAHARSALQEARLLSASVEGFERLTIQVLNTLAYVQRALGRPQQAVTTLSDVASLLDAPTVTATDRGDYLSGYGLALLVQADADPRDLEAAQVALQRARQAYLSASGWYNLARTDQNLALIDLALADRAAAVCNRNEEMRCLADTVDRLLPALLAKFALRFTLMSAELRHVWNQQQAQGLELAVACALRLDDSVLVADLVLLSRVQGVRTPASAPAVRRGADAAFAELQQIGRFPTGTSDTPIVDAALADLVGLESELTRLAPSPLLMAPDGRRIVLKPHYDAAAKRYGGFGLPINRLHRTVVMRL